MQSLVVAFVTSLLPRSGWITGEVASLMPGLRAMIDTGTILLLNRAIYTPWGGAEGESTCIVGPQSVAFEAGVTFQAIATCNTAFNHPSPSNPSSMSHFPRAPSSHSFYGEL